MKRIALKACAAALTLVWIASVYLRGLESVRMHPDEKQWILRGAYFFQAYFIERDFSSPIWRGYFAKDQAKLPEYLYGAWTRLIFREPPAELFARTGFAGPLGRDETAWEWFFRDGEMRGRSMPHYRGAYEIVVANRRLSVMFTLGVLVVVLLIGSALGRFWAGMAAVTILASSPMFFDDGRRAMSESMLLFFLALSFLGVLIHQRVLGMAQRQADRAASAVLLGVVLGLCAATKLNGLMASLLLIAWESINIIVGRGPGRTVRALALAGCLCTAALVFLILHPYLWPDPAAGFWSMLTHRQAALEGQIRDRPAYLLATPSAALDAMLFSLFRSDRSPLLGFYSLPLAVLLTLAGFVELLRRLPAAQPEVSRGRRMLVFWSIGTTAVVAGYVRIAWPRYYLPLQPWLALVQAFGLLWWLDLLRAVWRSVRRPGAGSIKSAASGR